MPLTRTQVAELEAEIDDEQLSKVRFGRSRFLRDAGLARYSPRNRRPLRLAAMGPSRVPTAGAPGASGAVGGPPPRAEEDTAGGPASAAGFTGVAIGSPGAAAFASAAASWVTCADQAEAPRRAASRRRAWRPRRGLRAKLRRGGVDLRVARRVCGVDGDSPADPSVRPQRGLRNREFRRASEPGRQELEK